MQHPCQAGEDGNMVRTAIHFFAGTCGIAAICKTDESKALGPLSFSVSGQEHSGDTTEPLEQIPDFLLLCQLADL